VVPGARIGEAMSRNRSSTACECGLWSFRTEAVVPAVDPLLLTESAYFDAAGFPLDHRWRRGNVWMRDGVQVGDPFWGYGYREDLAGPLVHVSSAGRSERWILLAPSPPVHGARCSASSVGGSTPAHVRALRHELLPRVQRRAEHEDLREMREWTPEKLAALAARWNLEER
jgi:hypothetical protein